MKKNVSANQFEQISDLLEIYQTSQSKYERDKAKAMIASQMVPVVKRIAKTIARRSYDPIEDLVQAGFVGLLTAIERYSKNKNDNFRVYAGYFIIGEMKHYVRDKLNLIKVPRYIQELTIRFNNFTENLTEEEVRSLTSEEVASALEVPKNMVDLVIQAERRCAPISLDGTYYTLKDDPFTYDEVLVLEDYKLREKNEDARIIFEDVIEQLPPEEKILIDMYYHQDMTRKEISEALQMNPMNVTRKLRRAFDMIATLVAEKQQETDDK